MTVTVLLKPASIKGMTGGQQTFSLRSLIFVHKIDKHDSSKQVFVVFGVLFQSLNLWKYLKIHKLGVPLYILSVFFKYGFFFHQVSGNFSVFSLLILLNIVTVVWDLLMWKMGGVVAGVFFLFGLCELFLKYLREYLKSKNMISPYFMKI